MKKVGIAAFGHTPFTRTEEKIENILGESVVNLFDKNSKMNKNTIEGIIISTNDNSKYLSPIVSEMIGIQPNITHSLESLCSSGSNALVSGYSYISSGLADVILICGGETFDNPGQVLEWDNSRGEFKHPIFWGSIFSKTYKETFGVSDEQLAIVPVKNHQHAKHNPYALTNETFTLQQVLNSKIITDDLRLLDCSRSCTGSASIVLASEDAINEITKEPIWITGIGQKTTSAGFTKTNSFDTMESTKIAGKTALEMSKHRIKDIDVAEVHDAFSVCEPMALEALSFTERGKGAQMVKEMYETEDFKINPRGGLIGTGHPLGATGISQTIEIVQQLQNNAGKRQVDSPSIGLVHNMAAAATSSTVLVLEK